MLHSKYTVAIPPGATIREQLENRGMQQKEFAQRMGLSEKHISRLINGKVELTIDVSLRLESVLGMPAKFWINMESLYRENLARVLAELDMDVEIDIASKFPYDQMISIQWIPITKKSSKKDTEKVENLRSFFEVAKLDLLNHSLIPGINSQVNEDNENNYEIAVWTQKARLEARKMIVSNLSIERLKSCVPEIRKLVVSYSSTTLESLKEILAQCGVALVLLPPIGDAILHGVSFIEGNHIVLGLVAHDVSIYHIGFNLFHELAHIINGHISDFSPISLEQEKEADSYARNTLINPSDYELFINKSDYSEAEILNFAKRIEISPDVILVQLQEDQLISENSFNHLISKFQML